MRSKRIAAIFLLFAMLIVQIPGKVYAFIAQEHTQTIVKLKAIAEWLNTVQMKLNQLKMLAQLPEEVLGEIQGMKDLLLENFSEVRGILEQVESITHFTDDLEAMLKDRHPDWQSGLSVEELSARNDKRDRQWKETVKGYLKALNMNAKEFKNDEKARKKMMKALSSAEGQVQALQSLGALVDHANSMLARDEQTLQSFITTYLESERDDIDKEEQARESYLEAVKALKDQKVTTKTFKVGFGK